jgi:hypothetical protein
VFGQHYRGTYGGTTQEVEIDFAKDSIASMKLVESSLSANSLSQSVDIIGLPAEQIEAIPHSIPHSTGAGISSAKTNFYFQKNSIVATEASRASSELCPLLVQ